MLLEDRWFQTEAVDSLFNYFENRRGMPGNPVVAAPTGTGKSVIIARFVRRALNMHPRTRIMMLTHVKELIAQNEAKLLKAWDRAPIGVYSAGLKRRDVSMPIIYGGVASVKNNVVAFGHRDLLLIDEAHLLSPDSETMYQQVIAEMLAINPYLKIIGFTATPFRMKQGYITDGGIFTDICYDATTYEMFNRLIAEGYLSPPIPKRTDAYIDVSGVKIVNGEYAAGELEAAADDKDLTFQCVKETCEFGYNRQSWLIFATGINHAEHIAEMMRGFGIPTAAVHSKRKDNDQILEAHKRGELRAIVNVGKLTTGYDHPPIDLIGMMRPTLSPGLWVQMIGRGTRPSPETGKQNCLVLDFARNTPRLGPINDPIIPRKPGKGGGDAPVRECGACGCYNHASARFCFNCGEEFTFEQKLVGQAGREELLRADEPVVKLFDVSHVIYNLHEKHNTAPMMKVSYFCGYQLFHEYIQFEASHHYPRRLAKEWWQHRSTGEVPLTTYEALQRHNELRQPARIRVQVNLKHPEILGYEY